MIQFLKNPEIPNATVHQYLANIGLFEAIIRHHPTKIGACHLQQQESQLMEFGILLAWSSFVAAIFRFMVTIVSPPITAWCG